MIGRPRFERRTLPDGRPGRAVAVRFAAPRPPVRILRGNPGNITAVVAASTVELDAQLAFLGVLLAVTAVGTMAVAGGVAWLAVSRGLRPLERVARDIGALDETGLKQRIAARGVPREIEPLVSQLNGLLARLDEAFNRERALTADSAHELRTPVAEVRAITEVTLSRPRPPEEYRRALGETLESARALQGLIEKLLVLARLEAGQVQPELEPLALGPLLADHWGAVAERAAARRLHLINQAAPDVVVAADAELVGVVLSNVFVNAVTYTPEGHDITITTQMSPDRCRLEVANGGCVLRPEDVNRVFDRFWRADPSRGRSGLHCGLGLTLVRRAMEAMGGTAGAEVRADGRFVLALELPRTR